MNQAQKPEQKIAEMRSIPQQTMISTLGIEFGELSLDCLVATMPVDGRSKQPFGLLHGGASVALAETLASFGCWLNIDTEKYASVGVEINANHVRAVTEGVVTGVATPLHRGRTTHVWQVRIENEAKKLVCISRCTLAVVPLEKL